MKALFKAAFFPFVLVLGGLLIWNFFKNNEKAEVSEAAEPSPFASSARTEPQLAAPAKAGELAGDPLPDTLPPAPAVPPKEAGPILLTAASFENLVADCFQGEACKLEEDPWKLYRLFKKEGKRRANDNLIAFLRSQLKDPLLKAQYKDVLKRMIEDFYPPRERQFQEAAYYAYLGELQKSLELYLDLEKKAAVNRRLRGAPKLNIANVYYDMARYKEALAYYQAALEDLKSGRARVGDPGKASMMDFIYSRIGEIEKNLETR
jgi:tetratricopeptide (TPR) repeat protein